jgi:selenocysteine lyase/cysteine desulfurase
MVRTVLQNGSGYRKFAAMRTPPKIDLARARAETRGVGHVIHLNNAGASLMPIPVADALYAYLQREEFEGGYETVAAEQAALENFYTASARLLNAKPQEIAFIENATRAWDMVFYAFPLGPGDRIVTSHAEYGSNLIAYLQRARQCGAEIDIIPADADGIVDLDGLKAMIDDRVKLISISHIPTGGGLINPAIEIGQIARDHCIAYLLDACQSAGQLPLDVAAIGCDFLSATGRKYLRGPRGTGLLYVAEPWIQQLEPPMLDQHAASLTSPTTYDIRADARRFENWECFFAGKAALGTAIDYALDWGVPHIADRVITLADQLRQALTAIDGITITDQGRDQCGIVTFTDQRQSANQIKQTANAAGFNISVSSGSGMMLDFTRRNLSEVVRASVHYFNSEDEIAQFAAFIAATPK